MAFPVGATIITIRLLTIHPQSLSKSLLCLSTPVLCPKLLPPIPTSPIPRPFLLSVLESEGRSNFPRGITTIALHSLRSYHSPKNLIKSNPQTGRQFLCDEHVLKRLNAEHHWCLKEEGFEVKLRICCPSFKNSHVASVHICVRGYRSTRLRRSEDNVVCALFCHSPPFFLGTAFITEPGARLAPNRLQSLLSPAIRPAPARVATPLHLCECSGVKLRSSCLDHKLSCLWRHHSSPILKMLGEISKA